MKRIAVTMITIMVAVIINGGPIGSWTSYLAYSDITDIAPAGKMVYVLSSKGLFSYNTKDHSIQTYDKMNALSDCNISYIAWCQQVHRLIIIYENQNIDLLDEKGHAINISDYYNKSMTADKTVNDLKVVGENAFISTNFGILKLNVSQAEISATYNLGRKVMASAILGDYIYAACGEQGIIKGKTSDNLLDKTNWSQEADFGATDLFAFDGKLFAATDGFIYRRDGNTWQLASNAHYTFCNLSGNKLFFGHKDGLCIFNNATDIVTLTSGINHLKAFVYDTSNKCYWSNQSDNKLYSLTLNDKELVPITSDIVPDGPKHNYFGFMRYANNRLYSCGGGYDSFAELFREAIVQTYSDDQWTIYEDELQEQVGNLFQDFTCLDFDPKDPNHVFVGGRAGIYEYLNGKFIRHYNCENSPLMYATPDNSPNYILVLGLKFDKKGSLWCLNSLAEKASILELKTDGTWEEHHKQILMDDNNRSLPNMKCMILDSRGLFWFVNNHWSVPSFYCFDPNNDAMNHYVSMVNEDGTTLTLTGVRCIAEDKEGNMWMGTNVGPLMLPAEDLSKGSNVVLQQVKVPRNDGTNFADYLLSGVDITCIAIDGGNRKWFGTNGNGAYLISDDNMTQVQHFLTDNSMLLSNNIESITINDDTGEVFFGTDNGLCSYMSDATATNDSMSDDKVYAYPNPVRPDYTGLITVTGLTMNADVKIVNANGSLIAEGVSNGGTFTWDGCDSDGRRVASGVYMVMTATKDGSKGTVCKIAIVN